MIQSLKLVRLLSRSKFRMMASATHASHHQTKRKVVVTARAFEETYDVLTSAGLDVIQNESNEPWSRQELLSHAHDAHAILAFMFDSCDEELLDACPSLEIIACALKGFDNFDTKLCTERGVAVTAVPDLLTGPTAEMAILLALGLGRRIREADHLVRSSAFRGWRPTLYGAGIGGATVGIYGAGAVGRAIAERIRGFAPDRILYVDPIALDEATSKKLMMEPIDNLSQLLQKCDILFICTPLNLSTHHSINKESLSQAKAGLQLINISRGSCVDEAAVADALDTDFIAGYASDVFEFEDWILEKRPKTIEDRLLSHPCTLFSPHLGSAVVSTRREIERAAAEEVVRWSKGKPYNYRIN